MSPSLIKQLNKTGGQFGLRINNNEVNSANIGLGFKSVVTAVWMENFFQMVGDPMPNTDGEIHLEKQEKKSIWKEYCSDFRFKNRNPLEYKQFCSLWKDAFPHVKIRAYKVWGIYISCFVFCRFIFNIHCYKLFVIHTTVDVNHY